MWLETGTERVKSHESGRFTDTNSLSMMFLKLGYLNLGCFT